MKQKNDLIVLKYEFRLVLNMYNSSGDTCFLKMSKQTATDLDVRVFAKITLTYSIWYFNQM